MIRCNGVLQRLIFRPHRKVRPVDIVRGAPRGYPRDAGFNKYRHGLGLVGHRRLRGHGRGYHRAAPIIAATANYIENKSDEERNAYKVKVTGFA